MMRERGTPSASSMAANVSRAESKRSARSFPIPTFCAPWPGHITTITTGRRHSPPHPPADAPPPGNPAPERDDQEQRAFGAPPLFQGLLQCKRDRRSRRVPVLLEVHHDLVHRDPGMLSGGLDDPHIGLVGNEE